MSNSHHKCAKNLKSSWLLKVTRVHRCQSLTVTHLIYLNFKRTFALTFRIITFPYSLNVKQITCRLRRYTASDTVSWASHTVTFNDAYNKHTLKSIIPIPLCVIISQNEILLPFIVVITALPVCDTLML